MDTRYETKRRQIEEVFCRSTRVNEAARVLVSPSARYQLEISTYSTGPNSWAYSRGLVTRLADGKRLADVKRNIGHFWHCWIAHPNGSEYLLCGEDYQGYCVLNLTDDRYQVYFPEEAYRGMGFCWGAVYPSPDGQMLAVDGCYWGCPYEVVFYDFRLPDNPPFRELARYGDLLECEGWLDNSTFILTREIEVRKSDGVDYKLLSDAEQESLDADGSLVEYRKVREEIRRPDVEVAG